MSLLPFPSTVSWAGTIPRRTDADQKSGRVVPIDGLEGRPGRSGLRARCRVGRYRRFAAARFRRFVAADSGPWRGSRALRPLVPYAWFSVLPGLEGEHLA